MTHLWVALAFIPFLIFVGLSPFLMRRSVDDLGSKSREAAGELAAHAIDTIQGLAEVVAFQQEKIGVQILANWVRTTSNFACHSFQN